MFDQIQRRYELILTAAGEGIYGLDREGKATFVNPAAVKMTGWSPEEIIGKSIHDLHHHSKADGTPYPLHECPIYAVLKDGIIHRIDDEVFWHKDGTSFPVCYTSTPIREDGDVVGAVVVFQDVTEQKRAEQALEKLQRRNELILAAAGEGICGVDCEGTITFVNPAAVRMFGWTADALNGRPFQHMVHHTRPDGSPYTKEVCPIYAAFAKGAVHYVDNDLFWHKDGHSFPVEYASTPIRENDRPVGAVIVFRDVSEKKRAEQQLRAALSEVQQLKERLEAENSYLQDEIKLNHNFEEILGRSAPLGKVLHQVEQVAATDATVLILGETGTGKELIARSVHDLSLRKGRPLVKVNCAAIPPTLIESELFGHEKGSFTGAIKQKIGRFELAHCGTIFLDEIGELPLELQAKLLRVLQEGELERLGDTRTIRVDVRVIAATNRDLKKMVRDGEFRDDLYYRLSVFPIAIPPLRRRRQDIALLVRAFVGRFTKQMGKAIDTIPVHVMDALRAYSWPGNVRELENVIERAVILTPGRVLQIPELFDEHSAKPLPESEPLTLDQMEKKYIEQILRQSDWRIAGERGAAAILGIHPNTLRSRMQKLGIRRSPEVV